MTDEEAALVQRLIDSGLEGDLEALEADAAQVGSGGAVKIGDLPPHPRTLARAVVQALRFQRDRNGWDNVENTSLWQVDRDARASRLTVPPSALAQLGIESLVGVFRDLPPDERSQLLCALTDEGTRTVLGWIVTQETWVIEDLSEHTSVREELIGEGLLRDPDTGEDWYCRGVITRGTDGDTGPEMFLDDRWTNVSPGHDARVGLAALLDLFDPRDAGKAAT